MSSPTFVPQDITIRGDFGRTFKLLLSLGGGASSLAGAAYSLSAGKWSLSDISGKNTNSLKSASFDPSVKNGYGCTKILQAIISKVMVWIRTVCHFVFTSIIWLWVRVI